MYRQICSSGSTFRSSPSQTPTPPPDSAQCMEEDLCKERESYDALVKEGGRPSHPVHLGFDVVDNPGEYKDILSYWRFRTQRLFFRSQLNDWRKFCEWQRKIRRYYQNRFPDYPQRVRERRQRHGLVGDVELHQEPDRQSRLDNWMEYQDYEYQILEQKEKTTEQAQGEFNSAQKELEEAGVPGFEGGYDPNSFGSYYGLSVENGSKRWQIRKEKESIDKWMGLARKRLEAAKSDDSKETVERAALIEQAQEDVEAFQVKLNEL